MHEVTVAGAGRGAFEARNAEQSIVEMVADAVGAALADAGIELADTDAAVTASVDLWDGRTASNVSVTEVVGAVMKPETRIAADGLAAFAQAAMAVAAGTYETVLCVAHCKPSESDHQALTAWTLDPVLLQPLGLDDAACAGLQADACGGEPGRWAEAVARARARAAADPLGPGLPAPSAEQVLSAPPLAEPLTEAMAAPLLDGAAAVVLARAEVGSQRPRLAGLGYALDEHQLGDRDLVALPALREAAGRAVRAAAGPSGAGGGTPAAGEGQPPADPVPPLALAEISAPYAHQEDLFAAAIGAGAAGPAAGGGAAPGAEPSGVASSGSGSPGGLESAALNPSGGGLAGAPPFVAGLARLIEVCRRLGPGERGLAHGTWGPAGQAHCVAVLER